MHLGKGERELLDPGTLLDDGICLVEDIGRRGGVDPGDQDDFRRWGDASKTRQDGALWTECHILVQHDDVRAVCFEDPCGVFRRRGFGYDDVPGLHEQETNKTALERAHVSNDCAQRLDCSSHGSLSKGSILRPV